MVEVIGALAFYQSLRLGWTMPDLVVPILPKKNPITSAFAAFHNCPCPHLFSEGEMKEDLIEEQQVIWLLDEGASDKQLDYACKAIWNAFPKKVYHLSLRTCIY